MFETVDYQRKDGVAWLILNRPQQHNAINDRMHRELAQAWSRFREDRDAIVAIVTGSGSKAFCTGADISDLPVMESDSRHAMRWTSQQNDIWKPVICAVNGMAVGGGLHFIADSDIVIAADNASFFDTHVKVGLVAGLEPVGLCRRMPFEAVMRMALMGGHERIDADQALRMGMVSEVVPAASLRHRAAEIADLIKRNSPCAMARTKRAIWQAKDMPLQAALDDAWRLIMEHNRTPDFQEGGRAFMEKRLPNWQPYEEGDVR